MSITKRFIYLLGFGVLLLLLTVKLNNSIGIFILYNLICFASLIIDYLISPNETCLKAERIGGDSLSIYEKEEISFELYNKSNFPLKVLLKDEIPDFHFEVKDKMMKGIIMPHEKKVFKYYVTPTKRGAFTFKKLHISYEGRLKLCSKMFSVEQDREYKVYPNLKNLNRYRLSICNSRRLKQGQKSIKTIGRGTSFESLREYVPGDEYRKINWKATARENKPIINQYEPEKNQHVHMLIDTGRAMGYSVKGYRKLDMVVNTAIVLSDAVNQNGDQSALMIFNTKVDNMIMPGKGVEHRNKILESLYHIEANNQTPDYEDAFYYFKKKERHRSIVVLFTDFDTAEEAEDMLKVLPVISRNNIVIIMLIKNESIEEISSQKVNNGEDLFNKGVALEMTEERKNIIKLLNRKGIFCIECAPEKLQYETINKYIQVKNYTYL